MIRIVFFLPEPLSFTPYDKCSVYGVILDLIPSVGKYSTHS